jgi:hypothetical protein
MPACAGTNGEGSALSLSPSSLPGLTRQSMRSLNQRRETVWTAGSSPAVTSVGPCGIARIVWKAPGAPFVFRLPSLPQINRGRAGRRGPGNRPGLATPACRTRRPQHLAAPGRGGTAANSAPPKRCEVRRLPGVPRAVFIGLLRAAPGGLTFQAPSLSSRAPIHRWWDKSLCRGMAPLVRWHQRHKDRH